MSELERLIIFVLSMLGLMLIIWYCFKDMNPNDDSDEDWWEWNWI